MVSGQLEQRVRMITPKDEFTGILACDHFYSSSFTLSIHICLLFLLNDYICFYIRSNCFSIVYIYIIYILRRYIHRYAMYVHVFVSCRSRSSRHIREANVPYNTNLYINIIMYKHRAMVFIMHRDTCVLVYQFSGK